MKTCNLFAFLFLVCFGAVELKAEFVDFSIWDCPYQCHGDADCQPETLLEYRVYMTDLSMIMAVYNAGEWPAVYSQSLNYNPAVDFDRNFKVNDADIEILEEYFEKTGVPGDCGAKFEFTINPDCILGGSVFRINWLWRVYTEWPDPSSDYPALFSLYYSTDGGLNWEFIDTVSEEVPDVWIFNGMVSGYECFYDWNVPVVDSDQCMLKIIDEHPGLIDETAAFSIYPCQGSVEADLDNNCYVDVGDIVFLAGYWLNLCDEVGNWCEGSDFDLSMAVDMSDYLSLSQNWALCGNPCDPNCLQ